MNNINQILFPYVVQAVSQSFEVTLSEQSVQFQDTRKEFEGDTTLVVFPITKFVKQSPEQLGTVIGEYLVSHCPEVKGFNVVKGFLNLVIHDSYWFQSSIYVGTRSLGMAGRRFKAQNYGGVFLSQYQ